MEGPHYTQIYQSLTFSPLYYYSLSVSPPTQAHAHTHFTIYIFRTMGTCCIDHATLTPVLQCEFPKNKDILYLSTLIKFRKFNIDTVLLSTIYIPHLWMVLIVSFMIHFLLSIWSSNLESHIAFSCGISLSLLLYKKFLSFYHSWHWLFKK